MADEHRDPNLRALAIQDRGRVLVLKNQVNEGMRLLDEAMAAALSGELSPLAVGTTYCNMISTCARIADYRRAVPVFLPSLRRLPSGPAPRSWGEAVRIERPSLLSVLLVLLVIVYHGIRGGTA